MQSKGSCVLAQGVSSQKRTLSLPFGLSPLNHQITSFFGMYWEGSYYYDKVLPFGFRSVPFLFNLLSDAVEWILINECLISFVCHILDDFLIIEPAALAPPLHLPCQQSLSSMLLTFRNLGVPIALTKTKGPCTTLEFMGIILDTVRMEARLPADKVERIEASLAPFSNEKVLHPQGTAISYRDSKLCMQSYPPRETLSTAYD